MASPAIMIHIKPSEMTEGERDDLFDQKADPEQRKYLESEKAPIDGEDAYPMLVILDYGAPLWKFERAQRAMSIGFPTQEVTRQLARANWKERFYAGAAASGVIGIGGGALGGFSLMHGAVKSYNRSMAKEFSSAQTIDDATEFGVGMALLVVSFYVATRVGRLFSKFQESHVEATRLDEKQKSMRQQWQDIIDQRLPKQEPH